MMKFMMASIESALASRPSSLVEFRHSDPLNTSRSNWRSKYSGTFWNRPAWTWAHGFNELTVAIEKVTSALSLDFSGAG
jgi:hypothetical protein